MMRKLKKGGVLSIALPTDPGFAWRLGRLMIRLFSIKKTYNISGEEYEYINATEHINSVFNLRSIIRFHFKDSIFEEFLPLKIKSPPPSPPSGPRSIILSEHLIKSKLCSTTIIECPLSKRELKDLSNFFMS